jgi:hypothetical protein
MILPNWGSAASLQMDIPGTVAVSTGTPSGHWTVSDGNAEADDDDDVDVGAKVSLTITSSKPIAMGNGFGRLLASPNCEQMPPVKVA